MNLQFYRALLQKQAFSHARRNISEVDMAEDVLEALTGVFNTANDRFLALVAITQQVQRRGFYQNTEFHEADAGPS